MQVERRRGARWRAAAGTGSWTQDPPALTMFVRIGEEGAPAQLRIGTVAGACACEDGEHEWGSTGDGARSISRQ
jgi:hypothetical protein